MIESKYLKDDIKNIQQLCTLPALKSFETRDLAKLLKLSKIRQYEDGEIIIEEGATDQWLYFLLSGKIQISKNGAHISTIDKSGEVFGEMRLIDGLSRSTSIHAEGQTACLAVDISAKHKLDSDDEADDLLKLLYKVMMEYISVRLRLSNEKLIKAQQEIARLKRCNLATKPKDQKNVFQQQNQKIKKKLAARKEFVYTGIIETATGG
ncbi:MAG: cyclic nucleotide-binding domain-containing protein [Deltaproteobacteria bacterium]|nr:cyclic nucleotide-binding domain-containing protein [Deltaproteobacteria bacterium]